jgi:hypothetical protein
MRNDDARNLYQTNKEFTSIKTDIMYSTNDVSTKRNEKETLKSETNLFLNKINTSKKRTKSLKPNNTLVSSISKKSRSKSRFKKCLFSIYL